MKAATVNAEWHCSCNNDGPPSLSAFAVFLVFAMFLLILASAWRTHLHKNAIFSNPLVVLAAWKLILQILTRAWRAHLQKIAIFSNPLVALGPLEGLLNFANLGQRLANTFAKKHYLATLSWFWPPGSSFCERVANFS